MNKIIQFSPPDITDSEINEVIDTLKSGWITTGPKTKKFETEIANYCETEKSVCLNSATAGLELVLRLFDIGKGDEVITTPYTFAATSNVILHTGAKPVFVDVKKNSFNIDPELIEKKITNKTKAIISVDIGGLPVDYDEIYDILNKKKKLFNPKKNSYQEFFDRPIFISDAAHSFGAIYKNKKVGNISDFTVFSFHAVKNLTTAEGGAITFNSLNNLNSEKIYKKLMLLSLHGQSKDALEKYKSGGWFYTIELPGYKYNMTDIAASIGLAQLKRYNEILLKRKQICYQYINILKKYDDFILPIYETNDKISSYHLFPLRIKNISEEKRNDIIKKMGEKNISLNVHFIPVVMHPAYTKLGYNIKNFPDSYDMYKNEISLPVHSKLSTEDIEYICKNLFELL